MSDLLATASAQARHHRLDRERGAQRPRPRSRPASIAAHYTLGRKRLVPKQALDPLATDVRQTRYALERLSHALPDGSRFILAATAPRSRRSSAAARRGSTRAWRRSSRPIRPTGRAGGGVGGRRGGGLADRPDAGVEAAFIGAFLARIASAAPTPTELRRKFDFFWWTYSLRLGGTERWSSRGRPRPNGRAARGTPRTGRRPKPGSRPPSNGAWPASAPRWPRPVRPCSPTSNRVAPARGHRRAATPDDPALPGAQLRGRRRPGRGAHRVRAGLSRRAGPRAVQAAPDVRALLTAGSKR